MTTFVRYRNWYAADDFKAETDEWPRTHSTMSEDGWLRVATSHDLIAAYPPGSVIRVWAERKDSA